MSAVTSNTETVIQKQTGYFWSIKIEREVRRTGADPKYCDKDLVTVQLSGNEDTKQLQEEAFKAARKQIQEALEPEKKEAA